MVVYLLLRNTTDLKCLAKGLLSKAIALEPDNQMTSTAVFLRRIFDPKLKESESFKIGIMIVENTQMSPNRREVVASILDLSLEHKLEVFHSTRWYSAAPKHIKGLLSFKELAFKVNDTCIIDVWIAAHGLQKPPIHDHIGISIDLTAGCMSLEQTSLAMSTLNFGKPSQKVAEPRATGFIPISMSRLGGERSPTPSTLHSAAVAAKPPLLTTPASRPLSRKSDQASLDNPASSTSQMDKAAAQAKLNEDLMIKIKAREEVCRSLFLSNKMLKTQLEQVETQLSSSKKVGSCVDQSGPALKSFDFVEGAMLSKKPSVHLEILPKKATSKAVFDNLLARSPSRQSSITGFSMRPQRSAAKETQTTERRSVCWDEQEPVKAASLVSIQAGTFADTKLQLPSKQTSVRDQAIQTSTAKEVDLSIRRLTNQLIIPIKDTTVFQSSPQPKKLFTKATPYKLPSSMRKQLGGCFSSSDQLGSSVADLSISRERLILQKKPSPSKPNQLPVRRQSHQMARVALGGDFRPSPTVATTTIDNIHRTLLEMDLKFLREESKLNSGFGLFLASNYAAYNKSGESVTKLEQKPPAAGHEGRKSIAFSRQVKGVFRSFHQPEDIRLATTPVKRDPVKRATSGWRRGSLEASARENSLKLGQGTPGGPLGEFQHQRDSFLLAQMQTRVDQWNSFHRNRHNN